MMLHRRKIFHDGKSDFVSCNDSRKSLIFKDNIFSLL